MKKVNKKKFY